MPGCARTRPRCCARPLSKNTTKWCSSRDIRFESMCEHHLLPFFGKAHIAYLPNGKIVGLSKLARVVEILSRRPQVQERMTEDLADLLDDRTRCQGRGRRAGSVAHLHGHSRRAQAREHRHHQRHARRLHLEPGDASEFMALIQTGK